MRTFRVNRKKQATPKKAIAIRNYVLPRSSKVATEKAEYEAYLRKREKAFRMLDEAEEMITRGMELTTERILAERAAFNKSA
jgi:hypothetical protein